MEDKGWPNNKQNLSFRQRQKGKERSWDKGRVPEAKNHSLPDPGAPGGDYKVTEGHEVWMLRS